MNSETRTFVIPVERRKRVPLSDGSSGFTTIPDGFKEFRITVEVNFQGLASFLGERAARSKGRKAVEASGLIVVHAIPHNG